METRTLSSIPGMREKLVDGMEAELTDCVSESDVQW